MTDYDMPAGLVDRNSSFYLQPNTNRFSSVFTRQQQTATLSAPRWIAKLTFVNLHGVKAGAMDALIVKLKGGVNRVKMFDWRRKNPNGGWADNDTYAAGLSDQFWIDDSDNNQYWIDDDTNNQKWTYPGQGTPSHRGAGRGAEIIAAYGFAPGTQGKAGDYIGFGDTRIYMLTDDLVIDQNGEGMASFAPPLRVAVTATDITYTSVSGWFRLISNDAGDNPSDANSVCSYALDFVEDL